MSYSVRPLRLVVSNPPADKASRIAATIAAWDADLVAERLALPPSQTFRP